MLRHTVHRAIGNGSARRYAGRYCLLTLFVRRGRVWCGALVRAAWRGMAWPGTVAWRAVAWRSGRSRVSEV